MKKHTQTGGIDQRAVYGCAGGCDMTYWPCDLRTHDNQCFCEDCWQCGGRDSETGIDYYDLPGFAPDVGWQPIETAPTGTHATLRDQFAMTALQGILSDSEALYQTFGDLAGDCYAIADAMLKEREK